MIKSRVRSLASVFLLGLAFSLSAQPVSDDLLRRFAQLQAKPLASWTENDGSEAERLMLEASRQILERGLTTAERAKLRALAVEVIDQVKGPPAWIRGDRIVLSSDALSDMTMLGMFLGHDIFVESGDSFPVATPAIGWPFSQRAILPLMPSLRGALLTPTPWEYLKCSVSDPMCSEAQVAAMIIGTTGFLLAHEMGHLLLGHGVVGDKPRPLEEELAADRKAWSILAKAAPKAEGNTDSVEHRVRIAFEAGPLVVLRWLLDGAKKDPEQLDIYQQRFDAVDDMISADLTADVMLVAEEQPVVGRMRSLQVQWSEAPEEIYLNGVRLEAAEIRGKTLRIFGRKVQVFARRGDRFAFAESSIMPNADPEIVALSFLSLQPEAEETDPKKGRQWFELFRATATPAFRPRSAAVARDFYESLAKMGVGQLIDPELSGLSSHRDRFIVRWWRTEALPLGTWRPSPN